MPKQHRYYVYILRCSDSSYYTGITNNLEIRLNQHHSGYNKQAYTYKRRPVELVFHEEFQQVEQAIAFEKQLKGWTRKKKEALIKKEWKKLKDLAACKNETSFKNFKKK